MTRKLMILFALGLCLSLDTAVTRCWPLRRCSGYGQQREMKRYILHIALRWTLTPQITRCTANKRAASFTVTTTPTSAICRCTCFAPSNCDAPTWDRMTGDKRTQNATNTTTPWQCALIQRHECNVFLCRVSAFDLHRICARVYNICALDASVASPNR
jgi:hypothetical protein